MDLFFIDTLGKDADDEKQKLVDENSAEDTDDFLNISDSDCFEEITNNWDCAENKAEKKNNFNLENTYLITNYKNLSAKNDNDALAADRFLENSVIGPGFEKQHSISQERSKKTLKLERKKLREKTKGKEWFDMPKSEITEEIKTDFELLKMRSVLDRKQVYKKNDITNVPKYFQIGRVIESAADFYSGRIPKSQRRKTLVDELLADAEFKKYQKKKFKEIMDENRRKKRSVNTNKKKSEVKKSKR